MDSAGDASDFVQDIITVLDDKAKGHDITKRVDNLKKTCTRQSIRSSERAEEFKEISTSLSNV